MVVFCLSIKYKKAQNGNVEKAIPVGHRIKSLTFLFPCNMAAADDPDGIKLFGTGGIILINADLTSNMLLLLLLLSFSFCLVFAITLQSIQY